MLKGQLLLNAAGKELHRSSGVEHLFMLLDGSLDKLPQITRSVGMPVAIKRIVSEVISASRGGDAVPPHAVIATSWGRVTVEATWLTPHLRPDPVEAAREIVVALGDHLLSVSMTLHEHFVTRATRRLRHAGATPTQTRVGILLATGLSRPEIARRLEVKESSVIDAARKLYERLGAANAAQLGLWLSVNDPPSRA